MSAKILERLRKKALDLVMDNKPDEVRETLEQIKTLEEMMAASTKKQEGIESIKTADTLEQRPVLDLVTQRLNKEQELLKVQSDRAQKLKNKGVNDPYYKKYDEGSIFSGANTYDDYLELIEDYAQREANYLGSRADYKGVPYENRLEIATNRFKREANKDIINRKIYINYGGKDLDDVGGFTTISRK